MVRSAPNHGEGGREQRRSSTLSKPMVQAVGVTSVTLLERRFRFGKRWAGQAGGSQTANGIRRPVTSPPRTADLLPSDRNDSKIVILTLA